MEVQYLPKIEGSSSPEFDHPCCSARFLSDHLMLHRLLLRLRKIPTPVLHGLSLVPDEMQTHPFNHPLYLQYCEVVLLLCLFVGCFFTVLFFPFNWKFFFPLQFVCLFVWLCFIVIVYLGGYQLLQLQSFVWVVVVFPIVSLVGTEWKRSCKVAQDFNNHCFFK